jgi:predicted secreted protein
MPSTATRGYATKLRKVSGTNSTVLAQIRDITGPGSEADDIDVSNTDSTNRRREFIAGMVDEGEVEFDLVYVKAQASVLKALVGGPTGTSVTDSFEIELSDRTNTSGTGSVIAFGGYVKALGFEAPFEDKVTNTATIKLSGEVTFTPSA